MRTRHLHRLGMAWTLEKFQQARKKTIELHRSSPTDILVTVPSSTLYYGQEGKRKGTKKETESESKWDIILLVRSDAPRLENAKLFQVIQPLMKKISTRDESKQNDWLKEQIEAAYPKHNCNIFAMEEEGSNFWFVRGNDKGYCFMSPVHSKARKQKNGQMKKFVFLIVLS